MHTAKAIRDLACDKFGNAYIADRDEILVYRLDDQETYPVYTDKESPGNVSNIQSLECNDEFLYWTTVPPMNNH